MVLTRQDTDRALALLDDRIARFADLEPDWDSYGAKRISPTAIAVARQTLRSVTQGTEPALSERVLSVWIAPLPNGGVVLEWRGAAADLEVEIAADGALGLLLEERGDQAIETSERTDVGAEDVATLLKDVLAA
jgi:hypothetical protein